MKKLFIMYENTIKTVITCMLYALVICLIEITR